MAHKCGACDGSGTCQKLQKLHAHPWIPESVAVRGFVYDVTSGRLREIKDA